MPLKMQGTNMLHYQRWDFPKCERYDREHLVTNVNKNYKVTRSGDICYNPANLKFGVICKIDMEMRYFHQYM